MTYMVQGQTQYSTERKKSRKNKTPVKRNGKKEKQATFQPSTKFKMAAKRRL